MNETIRTDEDEDGEDYLCDHCGEPVHESEIANCTPDETGHCVHCGTKIGPEAFVDPDSE